MYNKIELGAAIQKLLSHKMSEEDESIHISEMSDKILDPEWMDYIFQTDEYCDHEGNLDVERVCDKILSYKPIML